MNLTQREQKVMERVIVGDAPKVIGHELGMSAQCVSFHLSNVRRKFKAKTNTHAAVLFAVGRSGAAKHDTAGEL